MRELQRKLLLTGAGEVLLDSVRYVAMMAGLVMLLGYVAWLFAGTP